MLVCPGLSRQFVRVAPVGAWLLSIGDDMSPLSILSRVPGGRTGSPPPCSSRSAGDRRTVKAGRPTHKSHILVTDRGCRPADGLLWSAWTWSDSKGACPESVGG